jgi:hypothetical protein
MAHRDAGQGADQELLPGRRLAALRQGASERAQLVVGVRRSDKDSAPHMAQAGLSEGKGHILVETPTGATGRPYVHFSSIRSDGTPIRGGSGLLYVSSKEKEQEVEIDRSAADQVGADTRAIVVEDGIDESPRPRIHTIRYG